MLDRCPMLVALAVALMLVAPPVCAAGALRPVAPGDTVEFTADGADRGGGWISGDLLGPSEHSFNAQANLVEAGAFIIAGVFATSGAASFLEYRFWLDETESGVPRLGRQ